jgi:protein-S-isoprenylcysteine O-methyltransferase Ste14
MTKGEHPRIASLAVSTLAVLVGGLPLLLFSWFLLSGPLRVVVLPLTEAGALAVDAALCLAFFIQHSVMIRRPFRRRLQSAVPEHYHGAVYAIASGIVLLALVVLWQESNRTFVELHGVFRWLPRILVVGACVVCVSGVRALDSFDAFGVEPILAKARGRRPAQMPLTIRGAYTWVRHPLYLAVLMMIWSHPTLTADRLLFNAMWTAWIVVGTTLEERDLVAVFGEEYREYQRTAPMLIPWRGPRSPAR